MRVEKRQSLCLITVAFLIIAWMVSSILPVSISNIFLILSLILLLPWLWSISSPFNPIFIYPFFVILYTTSFPIAVIFGERYVATEENINIILISGLVMLAGSLIGVSLIKRSRKEYLEMESRNYAIKRLQTFKMGALVITIALTPIYFYLLSLALGSGVSTKTELSSQLGLIAPLIYVFLCAFFISSVSLSSGKLNLKKLFVFVACFFLYYLVTGERDTVVRALLLVSFLLYLNRYVGKRTIGVLFATGLLLLPLSQSLKGLLSYGSTLHLEYGLLSIFEGEFVSQGRNFNWLLESKTFAEDIFKGSFSNDLLRAFYLSDNSAGYMFGRYFLQRYSGSGMGFTIIGQTFIVGGWFALFGLGLFSGVVLKALYSRTKVSIIYLFLYIMILFSFAYSLRADYANLVAGVLKISVIPILLIGFVSYILNKTTFLRKKKAKGHHYE